MTKNTATSSVRGRKVDLKPCTLNGAAANYLRQDLELNLDRLLMTMLVPVAYYKRHYQRAGP